MKKILIASLLFVLIASCKKEDPIVAESQTERIMLRIESVSSDGDLNYSPVISVEVGR